MKQQLKNKILKKYLLENYDDEFDAKDDNLSIDPIYELFIKNKIPNIEKLVNSTDIGQFYYYYGLYFEKVIKYQPFADQYYEMSAKTGYLVPV